jgi:GT2 family glycosyltransferase
MYSSSPYVSLSVVSHGQGALVRNLLDDLRARPLCVPMEIVLTINIPEDEAYVDAYAGPPLKVIRNDVPAGFGANHNAAFAVADGAVFVVANPDLRLEAFDISPLLQTLQRPGTGVGGPRIDTPKGDATDSPRRFPTLARLVGRVLSGRKGPDYEMPAEPIEVDWIGGMLMAFPREVYASVGGFDERFFMYMEDVDICRRLRDAGLAVRFDPRTRVVHDARRANRRDRRHLRWHLQSLWRYLFQYRVTRRWSPRQSAM